MLSLKESEMADSPDSSREKLKDVKSIAQLTSSFLVSKAIFEIKKARENELKGKAKQKLPKLETENKRLIEVFNVFSELVDFKLGLLNLAKKCLEDIDRYDFKDDPSINKGSSVDTDHLRKEHSTSFALLEKIDLEDHTLRVFENGLVVAGKSGRAIQVAIPLLGALLHDFGKSSKIREELLGIETGEAYKKHALVSKMYVEEILLKEFPSAESTLQELAVLVENHHPANNKMKRNESIKFIMDADHKARKQEISKLKS